MLEVAATAAPGVVFMAGNSCAQDAEALVSAPVATGAEEGLKVGLRATVKLGVGLGLLDVVALSAKVGAVPIAADAAAVAAARASAEVGLVATVRLTLEVGLRGYAEGGWGMSAALYVFTTVCPALRT